MKKILATLLVATMLLSCLTFVGFAAQDISSISEMLGDEFYAYEDEVFSDAFYAYNAIVDAEQGLTSNTKRRNYANGGTDPIYTYVYNEDPEAERITAVDATTASYVVMPFFTANVEVGIKLILTYDEDLLVPVNTYTDFMGDSNVTDRGYEIGISQEPEGLFALAYFSIVDGAKGDENGNATTSIVAKIQDPVTAELYGAMTMSVNLTGLEKGAPAPAEKEDIAVEDVAKGTAPVVVPVSGGYAAADWDSESFASIEDTVSDEDKAAAERYSCAFATVDLTNKNYDAVGMAVIGEDGKVTFFEAKKVSATGAYGIVFFGAEDVLAKYDVAPAAMLNGEIIYDENNVAGL